MHGVRRGRVPRAGRGGGGGGSGRGGGRSTGSGSAGPISPQNFPPAAFRAREGSGAAGIPRTAAHSRAGASRGPSRGALRGSERGHSPPGGVPRGPGAARRRGALVFGGGFGSVRLSVPCEGERYCPVPRAPARGGGVGGTWHFFTGERTAAVAGAGLAAGGGESGAGGGGDFLSPALSNEGSKFRMQRGLGSHI